MALVNIDSQVVYVGNTRVGLDPNKIPPSDGNVGNPKVIQAVLLLESGGPVRFNAVPSVIVTSNGEEGSMQLEPKGKLTVIGPEDIVNLRLIKSGEKPARIVVNYYGQGGN